MHQIVVWKRLQRCSHWTAASTLRGRRDAEKLIGGHRPSIGSAKQVNANDTTGVSNTKSKLFFMGASLENGEEEDCTASDPAKPPTAAVWPQGQTPAKSDQHSEAKLPFFPKTLGGSQLPKSNSAKLPSLNRVPRQNSSFGETAKGSGVKD